jgi:hypothetical protein
VGFNITLLNTSFDAAADLDGDLFVINIPSGIYDVQANIMGYTSVKMGKTTSSSV